MIAQVPEDDVAENKTRKSLGWKQPVEKDELSFYEEEDEKTKEQRMLQDCETGNFRFTPSKEVYPYGMERPRVLHVRKIAAEKSF